MTEPAEVTQEHIAAFAKLTGDLHPAHLDRDWAREHSPFGDTVAHGLLTLSMAVGSLHFDPLEVLALRRLRNITFRSPVRPGDALVVEHSFGEPRALAGTTLRPLTLVVRRDSDRQVVLTGLVDVVIRGSDKALGSPPTER